MNHKIVRCVNDLPSLFNKNSKVVTLFSGGLDSTYLLYLLEKLSIKKIIALMIDVGNDIDKTEIEQITNKFGAELMVIDARSHFLQDVVLPSIIAQSCYLNLHPISASLSRPIIAKEAVDLAKRIGADGILHTANLSQNSLRRLNGAIQQLGFGGVYGTPYEFSTITRQDKLIMLASLGVKAFGIRSLSGDSNLWCREFESGHLSDPEAFQVPEEAYHWSASHPSKNLLPIEVSITYHEGRPTKLNDKEIEPIRLIESLNKLVGIYGLGRFSGLEHLQNGEKVLEVREMPAAYFLLDAYKHLQSACIDSETIRTKMSLEQIWIREAIEGRWYGMLKSAAEQFFNEVAKSVSGRVQYRLNWRTLEVISIIAENPLYIRDRDQWEVNESLAALSAFQRMSGHANIKVLESA